LGAPVGIAEHFGFLRDWYVIGPFDGHGMKGFKTAYPPEQKVDLAAGYEGKDGKKLGWKRLTAPEGPTVRFSALVDLMIAVVLCIEPSVYAGYRRRKKQLRVSDQAVYDKLDGMELGRVHAYPVGRK